MRLCDQFDLNFDIDWVPRQYAPILWFVVDAHFADAGALVILNSDAFAVCFPFDQDFAALVAGSPFDF